MIKLIATDMDHTLLDDESKLPTNIEAILEECKAKNIAFIAASGRTMHSIETKFGHLSARIYKISDNGSQIKLGDQVISGAYLSKEDTLKAIRVGYQLHESSTIVTHPNAVYISTPTKEHEAFLEEYYQNSEFTDNLEQYADNAIKVTYLSIHSTLDNFNNIVSKQLNDTLFPTLAGKVWIDVIRNDVSKGEALRTIMKMLDIHPEESCAFGDYDNDISMLKAVKHSYAVANASDSVKAVVEEIIGSNNDQAVADKILEILA